MTSEEGHEVSVIIPTRDRPASLARTLLSALSQTDVEAEVLIVDDGSRTPVAEHLADTAPGTIRVLRHESPHGVAAARNAGIAAANGSWLAFLDDDDLWAPDKLRRQLDAAQEEAADFAFSSGLAIDEEGGVLDVRDAPLSTCDLHRALLAANHIPCCASNLIARSPLVRALGGFDTDLTALADWDLALRLSAVGKGAIARERLVAYTIHAGGMHAAEAEHEEVFRRFARKHAAARAQHGVALDLESWLVWRASSARLAGDGAAAARRYRELARLRHQPTLLGRAFALRFFGERPLAAARRLRRAPTPSPPSWLAATLHPSGQDLRKICRPGGVQHSPMHGAMNRALEHGQER